MELGRLRIDSILDGTGRFAPTASFQGTTDEQWAAHRDLLDEDGMLGFAMGGFLVRGLEGGRTALIDAGLGHGTLMGITGGQLLDNLAAVGVRPDEITDVLFTHLHIDHIGWASAEGRAVFPNATHRAAAADWDHFVVHHPGSEAERLAPTAGQFETWEEGGGSVLAGIDVLAAPGHTPGSTVMVLSSGSARAMLLGDVVHCPVQLVDDEWSGLFDVDPALARRTRTALARELEGRDIPIAAAHFPGMQFGRLLTGEGRRLFSFF
jgi:glyoxylase-like metal-dependent hydrolase (beta-lactamase superfamily II)